VRTPRAAPALLLAALLLVAASGPAAALAAFAVTRVELVFPNGRGEVTVPLRYPQLRAFGMLRFSAVGVVRATWKVDGRILGPVVEPTVFNEDLIVATPELPTFEPGLHKVTLEFTDPKPAFKVPTITYFVTAEDYEDFKRRMEKLK